MRLAAVVPVFNEAEALPHLMAELSAALGAATGEAGYVLAIVDDASTDGSGRIAAESFTGFPGRPENASLRILRLAANQGHQRAILAGLRHLLTQDWEACLILDGDGQDDPMVLPAMASAMADGAHAIFVARTRRAEPLPWVCAYTVYQLVFRLLLGRRLPIGNHSLLRRTVVERLCREGDLTHLAALVATYRVPVKEVATARRPRAGGVSKMTVAALLDYAAAAMTASAPAWSRLFTRLALVAAGLAFAGLVAVVGIKLFTNLAIAGWASTICLLTFGISLQALGFMAMTAFLSRILSQLVPQQVAAEVEIVGGAGKGPPARIGA